MQFTPKTERQIAEENLRPTGIYSFEVVDAKDEVSKKGNDMIKMSLHLYNQAGDDCGVISDYLLESISYKLRHAAFACGLGGNYESGGLVASDFIGKSGEVKLVIKHDKSGQYPDQNSVADYVVKKEGEQTTINTPTASPQNADLDDGIPF